MNLKKIIFAAALLFLPLLGADNQKAKDEMIELNFVNTPIAHLTKLISEITGNNLISDGEIPGNFTFVSQKPIPKKNLMDVYEMILRTKGYMIVNYEDKGFYMIRKNNDPQSEAIEFDLKKNNYEVVTELITLSYFKPTVIANIIKPYFSTAGKVIANDELNFLMVTDYYESIEKVKQIVDKIDTQKDVELKWVKLENVNVKNVFPQLKQLVAVLAQKYRKPIDIFEDKSSNSIIISYSGNDYIEVEALIKKADEEADIDTKAEVIYLKNSKSENIFKILTEMEKDRYEKGDVKDKDKVAINHDAALNAIIVMGDSKVIKTFKTIIEDLDKPRKQVFVRAKIVEISEKKSEELGVKWDSLLAGDVSKSGAWAAGLKLNSDGLPLKGAPTLGALANFIDITEIEKGISVGAAINLLQSAGAAQVISSPTLLCLDNEESSIYVGQNQPTQTSVTRNETTLSNATTSYSYKDIGLTLKIKPQIMSDNKVRLDISNILEEVLSLDDTGTIPTTTKREIKSTSIVNNGDDVVIAGLIKTKSNIGESKVPLLGDVPILGMLFTNEIEEQDRVNLLIVITPEVVNDTNELAQKSSEINNIYDSSNKAILDTELGDKLKEHKHIDDAHDVAQVDSNVSVVE